MGRWIRLADWLAAVFLMFLFPAVCIHVKLRDHYFEACAARVREYGEMIQKQGYLSLEVAEGLLSGGGVLPEDLLLTLWQERDRGQKLLTLSRMEEEACDYMGTRVYPFSDGDGLLFVLRLPADGFERVYYQFCRSAPQREYMCFFTVRDGLAGRQGESGGGEDEAISLHDTFYDPVSGNPVHAVCAGTDPLAQGVGAAEGGAKRGSGGGRGSRISGNLQRR